MLTDVLDRLPLLRGLLDFAFPPVCPGCSGYSEAEGGICDHCLTEIDWFKSSIPLTDIDPGPGLSANTKLPDSFPLFAAGDYSDPLKEIIKRFKFKGITGPVTVVADRIVAEFGDEIIKLAPAVLIPIPLHPSREYVRGYNQAGLFAAELSRRLDMPINETLLYRVKKRRPQAGLKKSRRSANIRSVFAVGPQSESDCDERRLILVDDVVTSGQTMFEARRVLIRAGYQVVGGVAVAHSV